MMENLKCIFNKVSKCFSKVFHKCALNSYHFLAKNRPVCHSATKLELECDFEYIVLTGWEKIVPKKNVSPTVLAVCLFSIPSNNFLSDDLH